LIDVGASKKFQNKPKRLVTPTLTKTRASSGGFWVTKLNRRLLPKDSCSLHYFYLTSIISAKYYFNFNYLSQRWFYFHILNLVHQECLRLQGIPGDIADLASEMNISPQKIMGAAGNAWPVPLVTQVIKSIGRAMQWN